MFVGGIQSQPLGQHEHLIPLHVIVGLNQGRPVHATVDDAKGYATDYVDSFISSYFIW